MNKSKNILSLVLFTFIVLFSLTNISANIRAYSPEQGQNLEKFIEKNNNLISNEEKEELSKIILKMNEYKVLSQEEREYIQECELNVIRKKLGDAQFEEYKRLIEKRSSGAEFLQPERFRLYELEKMLR